MTGTNNRKLAYRNSIAGLLYISAKEAAKRAYASTGTPGEQNEGITSVVLCALILEAGINEISEWHEFHYLRPPYSKPHGLPVDFDRMSVRTKWSIFPMIANQRTFNFGAEPWQSFNALFDIRNFLVHLTERPIPKSIIGLLTSKGMNIGDDGFIGFDVAKWACETVSIMFNALTVLVDPPKDWIPNLWGWTSSHSFPSGLSTPGDEFRD